MTWIYARRPHIKEHTGVSTDTARCTSRGEEDDGVPHKLNIVSECVQLILCKLGVGWIKLETVMNVKETVSLSGLGGGDGGLRTA